MKANLQTAEPEALARWEAMDLYGQIRAQAARRAEVRPPRRPAVRQRPDPPRHGAQQDPQGPRRQVADDGRLRRAVRAGLRLPRPADRAEGRSRARAEEARHVGRRHPPRLPRVRRALHRRDDRRVQAADGLRRLGPLLPDDELRGTRRTSRGRSASSSSGGSSTRARSRCTGASTAARRSPRRKSSTRITRRRRSTSSSRCSPASAAELARARAGAGRARRLGPHLDDDAVDDSVEPGDRVPSRVRLRAPTTSTAARSSSPRSWPQRVGAGGRPAVRPAGRADEGRAARGHPLPPSALRARLGRRARRLRHARAGHGRRAHRAGPRRRRLPDRREVRPRDLRAGRPGRPLPRHRASCSAASACSTPTRTSRRRSHERGRLWHRETFSHQYPHCWRCHNPVIFLATSQWFVRHGRRAGDHRRGRRRRARCARRRSTPSTTR